MRCRSEIQASQMHRGLPRRAVYHRAEDLAGEGVQYASIEKGFYG